MVRMKHSKNRQTLLTVGFVVDALPKNMRTYINISSIFLCWECHVCATAGKLCTFEVLRSCEGLLRSGCLFLRMAGMITTCLQ